ncbi:hypothetical protein H6F77_16100 [Microcoleus sp. FACHB-831]|uniref:hypothetical protein n=1 Tax=Microcoleus sp. FACHB-831 TaxID=2692827 RepID=UPI0019A3051E|nr:hypothetical protein [Microcoleus sp. FACHB-831]MBD1922592.1 hypothetical protein [Microcoleus sp. FACHB-831]
MPALAAENSTGAVRRVSISEATGSTGGKPVLIELSPGYGVNLSFIPTGETVEKVWFDNPAIATLDVDGCLSGLGGSGMGGFSFQQAQCQYQGATVLHIRQIAPLNFPNLPKTNSTLLTAITHGRNGRHVYLFRVVLGGNNPKYHTVEVVPTTITATLTRYDPAVPGVTDWQLMNRGLTVAEQKRLIRRSQPLWNRIQNFLARVKDGEQVESAAAASGVSLNLVRRLEELGRSDVSVPVSEPAQAPTFAPQNSPIDPFSPNETLVRQKSI